MVKRLAIVIGVVALLLMGWPVLAAPVQQTVPSSVSDDFSTNTLSQYNVLSGTWNISGGQLVGDGAISRLICTGCTSSQSLNEFYATVQVFIPATIPDIWSSISLTLYGQDTNQRVYFVTLPSPSNSYIQFNRLASGTETTYNAKPVSWTTGQWYNLKVLWRNAKLWGKAWPVTASEPPLWQTGYIFKNVDFHPFSVGVRTYGLTGVQFDNFSVTGIVAGTKRNATEQGLYFPETKNTVAPPTYNSANLPQPVIDGDPGLIAMYNKAWQILYATHIRRPPSTAALIRTYLDEAYDPNVIFQWDTIFMGAMYGRYMEHNFNAVGSLDNFYHLQFDTGFISRVDYEDSGLPHPWGAYPEHINPPLFAWGELISYAMTGDLNRVQRVLPALQAYADYISIDMWSMTTTHSLYWNLPNPSGMDNIALTGSGWADMSAQMVLMYNNLAQLYTLVGDTTRANENQKLANGIRDVMNQYMWDPTTGLYLNVDDNGNRLPTRTIAGFWSLVAGVANDSTKVSKQVANLQDANQFNTALPFPTTAKNDSSYDPEGAYWLGGVWAPTNYMVIKGLDANGQTDFARQATLNYLHALYQVYQNTGTLWEEYAPEQLTGRFISNSTREDGTPLLASGVTLNNTSLYFSPGTSKFGCPNNGNGGNDCMAKPDFVGWTGLGPIALLIEDVIGINVNTPTNQITWNVSRTDRNGIQNLWLGNKGSLSLVAASRASTTSPIIITANSTIGNTISLTINANGQTSTQSINANANNQIICVPLGGSCSGTPVPTNTPAPTATPVNPDGSPYSGIPYAIPGTVEAENYNMGGEGVAYHDTDTTNNGNATYRSGDGVDLETCTDTGCGYNVGYTDAGEWTKYTVNVTSTSSYTFTFRVASATTGGSFHLEVDGTNVTGAMSVPNTGGWQTWTSLTKTGISLTAGQHVFKWVTDVAGGNYNWFSVSTGNVPTNTPAPTATKTNTPSVPTNTSVPPTTTATPTGGTTTVNDATMGTGQNQFNYVGAWQHGGCTGCYNSDNSWDNTVNDYITVTFTGTQINFYGVKDPGHGQGAVSIDGGAETTVDFYAATRAGNQLLWSSAALTNGAHTFKLRVTGTKNASSSNTWAVPDRVDILSGSGSATATPTKTNTPIPSNTPVGPTATNTTVAPTATATSSGSGSISATAWYQVINQGSNLCVDANGGGTSNGTIVLQWTCGTGINQHWQFQPTDSGYYKVYPRHATSLVWDVEFGSTGDGANVLLWMYGGATNQQWQPVALGGGYYKFVARHSGKCLEVPVNAANGTQLQQRTCNGGTNQAFRLVQQP